MKAVLVMSAALDKSIEHTKWQQPLGLAYIAACVRDISDVSIIDCEVDEQYTKTLIKEIDNLRMYVLTDRYPAMTILSGDLTYSRNTRNSSKSSIGTTPEFQLRD